ncbi:MAG: hypothetical protein O9342_00340 [Beijerinckiaceae bacterium]|nr:hypothetical protein [Beijerinckiaceae bacterium]
MVLTDAASDDRSALSKESHRPAGSVTASLCAARNAGFFRSVKPSPEIIRLAVRTGMRNPLSLRNVEDLLHEGEVLESFDTQRRDKKAALSRWSAQRNSSGNRFAGTVWSQRSSRIDWPHLAARSGIWALSTRARSAAG